MNHYYSRIPADAIRRMFDGNLYAYIPHRFDGNVVIEDFSKPRMLRFTEPDSFIKNGEAYILFAKRGDALPVPFVPFAVTVIPVQSEIWLYEHEDGRHLVSPADAATLAGDPAWHRVGPVEMQRESPDLLSIIKALLPYAESRAEDMSDALAEMADTAADEIADDTHTHGELVAMAWAAVHAGYAALEGAGHE